MFKRSKKESAPQVGPDKEQFSGPTPVGDALEQEIYHTLRGEELTHRADLQESQAVVADPELLEQRRQTPEVIRPRSRTDCFPLGRIPFSECGPVFSPYKKRVEYRRLEQQARPEDQPPETCEGFA